MFPYVERVLLTVPGRLSIRRTLARGRTGRGTGGAGCFTVFSADDIGEPRPRGMKPELGSFPVLVVAQGKGQSDVRQVISDKGMSMDWGILASLGPDERRRVLAGAQRRQFASGDIIFHEGDPGDSLHLLAAGHVTVWVTTPLGESVILELLGPGAVFGELALLGRNQIRAATVRALERSETLSMSRHQFDELRTQAPAVNDFLIQVMAESLRRIDAHLMEALFVPADKRVLRRLSSVALLYSSAGSSSITVPVTQEVLANMAGTSRPTANQVLRAAEEDGIIKLGRRRISILRPSELRKRAGL